VDTEVVNFGLITLCSMRISLYSDLILSSSSIHFSTNTLDFKRSSSISAISVCLD